MDIEVSKDVLESLESKGFKVLSKRWENKNKDLFLACSKGGKEIRFYVKFKNDWFNKFEEYFPEETGRGDSINQEILSRVLVLNVDLIIICYPTEIFCVYPMQIKNYCEDRGLIREQLLPQKIKVNDYPRSMLLKEKTYCFPVSLLKSFDEFLKDYGGNFDAWVN